MTGLQNEGNTCYFNAAMQAFSRNPALARCVAALPEDIALLGKNEKKIREADSLHPFITAVKEGIQGDSLDRFSPLLAQCHGSGLFEAFRQEDAQELLQYVMDKVRDYEKLFGKKSCLESAVGINTVQSTIRTQPLTTKKNQKRGLQNLEKRVQRIFGTSRRKHRVSAMIDTPQPLNLMLSLDMTKGVSPKSMLGHFTALEKKERTEWYKNHSQLYDSGKLSITRLPPLLILHLKRFHFDGSKIRTRIENITNFQFQGVSYKIQGAICHLGETAGVGHYIYVHRNVTGSYTRYDDSYTSTMLGKDAINFMEKNGYIYFYQRSALPKRSPTPLLEAKFFSRKSL